MGEGLVRVIGKSLSGSYRSRRCPKLAHRHCGSVNGNAQKKTHHQPARVLAATQLVYVLYEISAYALGEISVFVPLAELRPLLREGLPLPGAGTHVAWR